MGKVIPFARPETLRIDCSQENPGQLRSEEVTSQLQGVFTDEELDQIRKELDALEPEG